MVAFTRRYRGLTGDDAAKRLASGADSRLDGRQRTPPFVLLLSQFKSPIILLLCFAAGAFPVPRRTYRSPDHLFHRVCQRSAGLLAGAWRGERRSETACRRADKSERVRRDGKTQEITLENIVPGDIVLLSAGDVDSRRLPGTGVQRPFCGRSRADRRNFPRRENSRNTARIETTLSHRANSLYMGTHVVSGTATALVIHIGKDTQFGSVSEKLRLASDRNGIRAWHPPFRLHAHGTDPAARDRRFRH